MAKFFLEVDPGLRNALRSKAVGTIIAVSYPGTVTFDSQVARLSEIDPLVALSLMYFYQPFLHLQKLTKQHRVRLSEGEAEYIAEAYELTLRNLSTALERTIQFGAREKGVRAEDGQLLEKVRALGNTSVLLK